MSNVETLHATSLLDIEAAKQLAPKARIARGIVAEPPNRMNEMNAVKVMERIARRERPKGAKRLAQIRLKSVKIETEN